MKTYWSKEMDAFIFLISYLYELIIIFTTKPVIISYPYTISKSEQLKVNIIISKNTSAIVIWSQANRVYICISSTYFSSIVVCWKIIPKINEIISWKISNFMWWITAITRITINTWNNDWNFFIVNFFFGD